MKAPHDQHFLTDKKAIERIASASDVSGKRVLEIGPGEGVLTRALLDHDAIVTAIELDEELIEYLNNRFHREIRSGKLTLIQGNAVKCDYPPFDISVSNLPYSASSKITFRLLEAGFEEAILMYQMEFGQRMIAPPGTPGVGRLSIMVQTYAKVKPIMQLSAKSFTPPPAVQSWVVRITPRDPPHPI
ncbi:MAG: ribosomal RNA small subunit methyltransferase A, partial [Methanomicrobiales archaeon]|nr:ribosomal RNA small subunit methyltransferase A [Methanomicrobiales archaeon]